MPPSKRMSWIYGRPPHSQVTWVGRRDHKEGFSELARVHFRRAGTGPRLPASACLVGDWVDPTALGYGFVIAQAVAVSLPSCRCSACEMSAQSAPERQPDHRSQQFVPSAEDYRASSARRGPVLRVRPDASARVRGVGRTGLRGRRAGAARRGEILRHFADSSVRFPSWW
jgi:hypothetical protein